MDKLITNLVCDKYDKQTNMNKKLENLREEIDAIDEEVVKLIDKRMQVVREIGKLKKEKNLQPLDEKRWQEVLEKIIAKAKKLNLPQTLIKKIYNEIHQAALKLEKEV